MQWSSTTCRTSHQRLHADAAELPQNAHFWLRSKTKKAVLWSSAPKPMVRTSGACL